MTSEETEVFLKTSIETEVFLVFKLALLRGVEVAEGTSIILGSLSTMVIEVFFGISSTSVKLLTMTTS